MLSLRPLLRLARRRDAGLLGLQVFVDVIGGRPVAGLSVTILRRAFDLVLNPPDRLP